MFDTTQSDRFQELRDLQTSGPLSDREAAELFSLERELIADEFKKLNTSSERARCERRVIDAQNRKFEEILSKKSALERKLRTSLREFRSERRALDRRLARILEGTTPTTSRSRVK